MINTGLIGLSTEESFVINGGVDLTNFGAAVHRAVNAVKDAVEAVGDYIKSIPSEAYARALEDGIYGTD